MTETKLSNEMKNTSYELFIGALSVLSIGNIFLMYIFPSSEILAVLRVINAILSIIFIVDFTYRFFTANSKKHYFLHEYGWADLLASIPLPQVKIFRIFRILRVYRLLRKFGMHGIIRELISSKGNGAVFTIFFLVICVLEFGSVAILAAESHSTEANITNSADALWWIMATITTVGYGDVYPVTNAGRLVGVFVMVIGIGLFSTIAGFLANAFVSPKNDK